jgi:hypothetical protein
VISTAFSSSETRNDDKASGPQVLRGPELPFDEECEQGWDYGYRGGLVKLTVKGGYLSGWADFSWNDVITDIFANEKLVCITKVKYEDIIKNSQEVANERDRLITANVKQLTAVCLN